MRASSDNIGQLAAAMAKARSELVNPVKSLTAVIERANGGGTQSYKYAPLSSGLDIVRKSLGKYELALIQTTHVDRERSLVLLTTTIAHGLMGAALTYARRYCLFTMVGLAGEDDLDAPDLLTPKPLGAVANGSDTGTNIRANPEATLQRDACSSAADQSAGIDGVPRETEPESPRRRRTDDVNRIGERSFRSNSRAHPGKFREALQFYSNKRIDEFPDSRRGFQPAL